MSSVAHSPPEQGQLVSVRSRQWIANDVRPSTFTPPALKPAFSGPQHLIMLSLVEDDIQTDDDCTDSLLKVPQLLAVRPRCTMHGGETVRSAGVEDEDEPSS